MNFETKKLTSELLNQTKVAHNTYLRTFLKNYCKQSDLASNIFVTTNLTLFTLLEENREVNPAHVAALVRSFKENYLPTIVYVNEYLQVIDGQHRVEAARKTAKPVIFCIQPGWGIKEVQILNVNSKNWTGEDFMVSFARTGNENYIQFRELFEKSHFPITILLSIVRNKPGDRGHDSKQIFIAGKLLFTEEMKLNALNRVAKIHEIGMYHPNGKSKRSFVDAVLSFISLPGYDHQLFLRQLRSYPDELLLQAKQLTEKAYFEIFEKVYNFKKREANRLKIERDTNRLKIS